MQPSMTTFKGKTVFLFDPDPESICIEDIAHHLALQNRFNGATLRPYSVAAHSLYMAHHLVPEEFKLAALMHDAAEAYIGDMISPLKRHVPQFEAVEAQFWEVIADKWGLPHVLPQEVKDADWLAVQVESYQLRHNGLALFEEVDPRTFSAPTVSRDDWETVKWNFLDMWNELV